MWSRCKYAKLYCNFARGNNGCELGQLPLLLGSWPAKLRQKDRDARWTVKYTKAKPHEDGSKLVDLEIPAFGYKNHVSADKRHRLIRKWVVTDAAAHDGKQLRRLLDKKNTASAVWAVTRTSIILGVVDIARTRVETADEIRARLIAALNHVDYDRLIAAPDGGLIMLDRETAVAKLRNLVAAARTV